MDSFRKSMDSYRFVPYKTNPGFVSYRGSRILTWKDSFWIVNHKSSQFSKIPPVFTNAANPHEFSQIISTIARNKSLKIQIRDLWIQAGGLANPDSRIKTLKICMADSIRRAFFKRFVSRIRFVRPKISNYLIHFDSEGFVYDSSILNNYLSH